MFLYCKNRNIRAIFAKTYNASAYVTICIIICFVGYCYPAKAELPYNINITKTYLASNYIGCDVSTDSRDKVAKVFGESENYKVTLIIDCPIFIHIGRDIAKPILIRSNYTVKMIKNGKFIVDNDMIPAFVMLNSSNIDLEDWNVDYRGSVHVDPNVNGYYIDGVFNKSSQPSSPSYAFHDNILNKWASINRNIKFSKAPGSTSLPWPGPVNSSAIIYIIGDSHDIKLNGINMFVDKNANPNKFIPVCISTSIGYPDNYSVFGDYYSRSKYFVSPHKITAVNIRFDGYLMGWLGVLENSIISKVSAFRYSDLQDANGDDVGGLHKWFPPPHLFYLYYPSAPEGAKVSGLIIRNVEDYGIRLGRARDKPTENRSGNASSIKIGAENSVIEFYRSLRPDGVMDLLPSKNVSITHLYGEFDTKFTSGLYSGIRFPINGFDNIKFTDIVLKDRSTIKFHNPVDENDVTKLNYDQIKVLLK